MAPAITHELTVVLIGTTGPLQTRVAEGLRALGNVTVFETSGSLDDFDGDTADVVVDMASNDHDWLARHRESSTQYATTSLGIADVVSADQVVFVSSAMVYGASANNPSPLTEETVLRPDTEFVSCPPTSVGRGTRRAMASEPARSSDVGNAPGDLPR